MAFKAFESSGRLMALRINCSHTILADNSTILKFGFIAAKTTLYHKKGIKIYACISVTISNEMKNTLLVLLPNFLALLLILININE